MYAHNTKARNEGCFKKTRRSVGEMNEFCCGKKEGVECRKKSEDSEERKGKENKMRVATLNVRTLRGKDS